MLIDTHLHLINPSELSYPWLHDGHPLHREWRYVDYEAQAKLLGISGALHMEVDVAEKDICRENEKISTLMRQENSLLRGAISSARPENIDFAAFIDGLDRDVVKGIRRVLHVIDDAVSQTPLFRANLRRLGERQLPFDICARPDQLAMISGLIDACEDVNFVLDHCGAPDIAAGREGESYTLWAQGITEIAKRPNSHVKISGLSVYAKPDWTLETLAPYVEHVIDAFGWDRVVWGSDSPVCTLNSNLAQWVSVTHALVADATPEDREKLFSINAKRIYAL